MMFHVKQYAAVLSAIAILVGVSMQSEAAGTTTRQTQIIPMEAQQVTQADTAHFTGTRHCE